MNRTSSDVQPCEIPSGARVTVLLLSSCGVSASRKFPLQIPPQQQEVSNFQIIFYTGRGGLEVISRKICFSAWYLQHLRKPVVTNSEGILGHEITNLVHLDKAHIAPVLPVVWFNTLLLACLPAHHRSCPQQIHGRPRSPVQDQRKSCRFGLRRGESPTQRPNSRPTDQERSWSVGVTCGTGSSGVYSYGVSFFPATSAASWFVAS